jgi:hypothetical protein
MYAALGPEGAANRGFVAPPSSAVIFRRQSQLDDRHVDRHVGPLG